MNKLADEFKLTCDLQKAYEVYSEEDGTVVKFVSGLASGKGLDLEQERMSESVLESFQKAINHGIPDRNGEITQIPLRSGHRTEWDDILGYIVKAELDGDYNLWITAELEQDNPNADLLYRRLTTPKRDGRPTRLGLSVGGKVISAGYEFHEDTQKMVRTYNEVALREISVVGQPAYPTAYVQALNKSVKWEAIEPKKGEVRLVDDAELDKFLRIEEESKEVEMGEVTEKEASQTESAVDIAKAAVLGSWTESDVMYSSLEALASNLKGFISNVMWSAEGSAEEKQALIAAGLDEFTRLVLGISSTLTANQTTEKSETEETPMENELEKNVEEVTEPVVQEDATKAAEAVVEELTEKAAEVIEEVEEENAIDALKSQVNTLTDNVTKMAELFAEYISRPTEVVVEEGVTEKSAEEPVLEEVVAVEKAEAEAHSDDVLKGFIEKIGELMDAKLKPIENRMTEIENAPVDKSLSITDDKSSVAQTVDGWNEDAMVKIKEVMKNVKGSDALSIALHGMSKQ